MNNRRMQKKKAIETGQSMVELAVSIVVLLILLAGVVDLGRIAFYYIAMRDAAQEAASYASVFPHRNDEIFLRALAGMNNLQSPSEIKLTIFKNEEDPYICTWHILSEENPTQEACVDDVISVNDYSPSNLIEVSMTTAEYPITMPLLGTYIGSQSISLNSTIQDVVVRVPEPTPSP